MKEPRKELEQRIIEKAMKDKAFRNKLTDSPKEVIEKELGGKLPGNLNVHLNKEGPNDIHITLPHKKEELSQEELSGVSGGSVWDAPVNCNYSV